MTMKQKDELIRERDFLKLKVQELTGKVRDLEYDCAELQRRESDLSYRLKEMSNYRPIRHNHNRNPVFNRK